jgi:hypothetical protein
MFSLLFTTFNINAFVFDDDVPGEQVSDALKLIPVVLAGLARFWIARAVMGTDLGLVPDLPAVVAAYGHDALLPKNSSRVMWPCLMGSGRPPTCHKSGRTGHG